jgi:hypothetical protein
MDVSVSFLSSLLLGWDDFKSGRVNLFAFTNGTAAWSVQASPFLERETTLFARSRLRSKVSWVYRLCNMHEMIEDFSFFNSEQF